MTTYLVASTRATQPPHISQPSAKASNVLPAGIEKETSGLPRELTPVSPNQGAPAAGSRTSPRIVALTESFLLMTGSPSSQGLQTLPGGESESVGGSDSLPMVQVVTTLLGPPSHEVIPAIKNSAIESLLVTTGTANEPGTVVVINPSTNVAMTSDITITSVFIALPPSSSVPMKSKEWTLASAGTTYTVIISGFPSGTSSESSATEVDPSTITGYSTATGSNRTTETNYTLGSSALMTQTITVTESASTSTSTLTIVESTRAKNWASEEKRYLCFLFAGLLLSMYPLFRF